MKETKVYVDELPESCKKCAYSQINLALGVETRICGLQYGFISIDIDKFPNCPLQSIKDHDRELVEKVLEKTKTFVRENTYICGGNATREDIITSSSYNQALRDVLGFMQTLQKEYEK